MISKQFVRVQEITDSVELSGANYVKLIQFSLPKEEQCREDRGEAVSVTCPRCRKVYDSVSQTGKCTRGEACKAQNRFGFVLKYCCLQK